jgi:predicted HicB family RNase H-like nuclease
MYIDGEKYNVIATKKVTYEGVIEFLENCAKEEGKESKKVFKKLILERNGAKSCVFSSGYFKTDVFINDNL